MDLKPQPATCTEAAPPKDKPPGAPTEEDPAALGKLRADTARPHLPRCRRAPPTSSASAQLPSRAWRGLPSSSTPSLSARDNPRAGSSSGHRPEPPFCAEESEKKLTRKWRPLRAAAILSGGRSSTVPSRPQTTLPPLPRFSPSLRPCQLPRVPAATKGRGKGKRRGGRGREPGSGAGEGKGGARETGRVSESPQQEQQRPDTSLCHLHREPTRRRV